MYPETDIPNIVVTEARKAELAMLVPVPWEKRVETLAGKYSLSRDLALKLYDSEMDVEFERLSRRLRLEPSVVASVLVDVPARLSREGVPDATLALPVLTEVLVAVSEGRVAKEAVPDILKAMGKDQIGVQDAIRSLGLAVAGEEKIREVVRTLVARKVDLVREKGEAAFSPLMGEAMRELRGKADGAVVARLLREEMEKAAG